MKEKIYIPGPAKSMYAIYLSALAVSIYTGFNVFHPFMSGWRYPWQMGFPQNLGMLSIWVMVLTAGVYLYYATLGRPKRWHEPLGWFRIILALVAIWWFLITYAVYLPTSWMKWLVSGLGGVENTFKAFDVTIWFVLLINIIYIYVRWAKSERFPRFRAVSGGEGVS